MGLRHEGDVELVEMKKKDYGMSQDERWLTNYNEVKAFIEREHRNPSRHRIEEHDMLNWLKANRKALNAGKMKAERVENFKKLLEMTEQYRRKNQYE